MDDETESPVDELEASEDMEDDDVLGDATAVRGGPVAGPGEDIGHKGGC